VFEVIVSQGKNPFGGREGSLYTPMSEDEQEVISRLVAARDLYVDVVGWAILPEVKATFGDLRIQIPIEIAFKKPEIPRPVHYFDMELRTGSGILLYKERHSASYGGKPLLIGAGTTISMIWDIAIHHMDPKLVKKLKPGAIGLTSRWIDKDSGEVTMFGNTNMQAHQRKLLRKLRAGEAEARLDNQRKRALAEKKASEK
jgi:hypothetical protein